MIAIILGGGAGKRLFPLTHRRSKPAVPLAGKYRLIDIPLSNSINSDVSRIFVLTQFNSASLNRHIAQTYRFDRFRHGFVNILSAEQTPYSKEWFQGTADAVRQSMQHVELYRYNHVLILSGDQLYTMDYREMLAHHESANADLTIATIPVTAAEAPDFGILKTGADDVIKEFYEKPSPDSVAGLESPVTREMKDAGRVFLASMGIYIFSKGILRAALDREPDSHDFGKEIIPNSIDSIRVVSYPFDGFWSDIGTIRSFYDANLMLAGQKPGFDIYNPKMPLYTNARMLPPAKIQRSTIENALIAEAAVVVNCNISNSVIGLRSFIGEHTTIRNTVMMGSDYFRWHDPDVRATVDGPRRPGIDRDSFIDGAIIDLNVSIGKGCVIRNRDNVQHYDGDGYYIRDGIIVIPKNASIPDGTVI
ncbi:MAG: glucose-1-phosphate adenylyltransferase [Bacteroidetes bacterium]|nr:glucose-1-phosphate adenylyltransferase [Bacteroidota bacterium]